MRALLLGTSELAQDSLYDVLVEKANELLDPVVLTSHFPQYKGKNIEIAGFIWFQGWNDGGKVINESNYEKNLTCLVNDLRHDINRPNLPIVIAQTHRGDGNSPVQVAQANVAADIDDVKLVLTEDLSNYYHFDAAAHLVIGMRMANSMSQLLYRE